MQLVDEIRREKLPREVGAADDHHIAILRRGFSQSHGWLDSIGDEGERDASVLLRMMSRRTMRDYEDRHLELVVVGQRVGVAHLECVAAHQHGARVCDEVFHVRLVLQVRQIRIQTLDAALFVGDETVDRCRVADDDPGHRTNHCSRVIAYSTCRLRRWPGGNLGCAKSRAGSWIMPIPSITRRERVLAGTVTETISSRTTRSKASAS